MNGKNYFFTLTPKGDGTYQPCGKAVRLTANTITIGESADCDVRYKQEAFQPEYYASIIRNDDEQSWHLVRRSQYVGISIEGKGDVGYACMLNSGDIIHFEGQQTPLAFQVHHEQSNRRLLLTAGLATIACIILAAVIFPTLSRHYDDPINATDIAPLEESILLIKTDSVQQILLSNGSETSLRSTKVLTDEAPTGTAFLTTDGILVTARHCVEYWIGTKLDLTRKFDSYTNDDIVKWAIETESFNQGLHPDSLMRLRVFFSVYDFTGEPRYSFRSDDSCVHVNILKDGILQLADFNNDYYWRTIQSYFQDKQMEMGDILWIDGLESGQVALPTEADMEKILKGTKLMVIGYPITSSSSRRVTFSEGTAKQDVHPASENIEFEANINHGFSGGPVLVKTTKGVVAAGVVSRVDSVSSGIFKYAVPTTEIFKTKEDTKNE